MGTLSANNFDAEVNNKEEVNRFLYFRQICTTRINQSINLFNMNMHKV